MKKTTTNRGFVRFDFTDHNDEKCSLQESSLAETSAIWLGINDVIPVVCVHNEGWQPVPMPEGAMTAGRMHITQEQMRELLPLLTRFADTGRLDEDY